VNTIQDLRYALSEEVRRLQPPAGLEARVLEQALRNSANVDQQQREWHRRSVRSSASPPVAVTRLMALVAVLLAITIVATLVGLRDLHLSTPTPANHAIPVLKVPMSTPVILYHDPANIDQIDGMTWDGRQSGKLPALTSTGASHGFPRYPNAAYNPAANLYATTTDIRDRNGKLVSSGTFGPQVFTGMWADDEVHFCQLVPSNSPGLPTTLQLVAPGQAASELVQLPIGQLSSKSAQTTPPRTSTGWCSCRRVGCCGHTDSIPPQRASQCLATAAIWPRTPPIRR